MPCSPTSSLTRVNTSWRYWRSSSNFSMLAVTVFVLVDAGRRGGGRKREGTGGEEKGRVERGRVTKGEKEENTQDLKRNTRNIHDVFTSYTISVRRR